MQLKEAESKLAEISDSDKTTSRIHIENGPLTAQIDSEISENNNNET